MFKDISCYVSGETRINKVKMAVQYTNAELEQKIL